MKFLAILLTIIMLSTPVFADGELDITLEDPITLEFTEVKADKMTFDIKNEDIMFIGHLETDDGIKGDNVQLYIEDDLEYTQVIYACVDLTMANYILTQKLNEAGLDNT